MSFMDTLASKGKEAADKAKNLADIAGLKAKVGGCDAQIKKAYEEIGKKYFEEIGSEPGAEYVDACETIKKTMAEKEELEEKIAALKEN